MITYCVIYNKEVGRDSCIGGLENFAEPES